MDCFVGEGEVLEDVGAAVEVVGAVLGMIVSDIKCFGWVVGYGGGAYCDGGGCLVRGGLPVDELG